MIVTVRALPPDTLSGPRHNIDLWGPSIAVVGAVLALFAWSGGRSAGLVLLGLTALVVGLLVPR